MLTLDDQKASLFINHAIINKITPNINVVALTDPIEALDWLEKKRADLIVTDYLMNKMNGIEFINAARLTKFGKSLPFIVVTASKNHKIHGRLLSAGVIKTFVKPAPHQDLLQACLEVLNASKDQYRI